MKTKIFFFLSMMTVGSALGWGQTWDLSATMKGVLDNNVLTISTTLEAEAMPEFEWNVPTWHDYNRNDIHEIVIEDGVTSISSWAFSHLAFLTSVTMANTVTIIESYGFYNCYTLPMITISENVTTLEHAAFKLCESLTEIEIPASVSFIGGEMFVLCGQLEAIRVHADNSDFSSADGVLYDKDKTTLLIYPEGKKDATFEIPGTVHTIGDAAFYQSKFESITIPNSVTDIISLAFGACTQLTAITIPYSVTYIGQYAFADCTGLTEVTVEWESPLSVPDDIFQGVNTSDATLWVPTGRTIAYQEDEVWKAFGTIEEYEFSGNETIALPALKAYAANGVLHITGLTPGRPLSVYNISGQLIYQGIAKADEEHIPITGRGVCIVVAGSQHVKVIQ